MSSHYSKSCFILPDFCSVFIYECDYLSLCLCSSLLGVWLCRVLMAGITWVFIEEFLPSFTYSMSSFYGSFGTQIVNKQWSTKGCEWEMIQRREGATNHWLYMLQIWSICCIFIFSNNAVLMGNKQNVKCLQRRFKHSFKIQDVRRV